MNADMGNLSLMAAMLCAAGALLFSVLTVKHDSQSMLVWTRRLIYGYTLAVLLGSWALVSSLVNSDFRNAYVASYTERALPTGYKVVAFWAGQEGSLMLWMLLLAGMSAAAVFGYRKRQMIEQAVMIRVLALVCGFFAALILFAANPFVQLPDAVADGHGLNPLLQDPYMIIHPPLLFVGYAAFTVPWAMLLAALITGRKDNQWIGATRRWLMLSWLFLTVGILLGAKWAYIELGWGGYWAWDPVENASLLPWLTGTALLHSVMVQQKRGMFKAWNASLIATTFLLCIFGTYLTRSGVVQSVHAFGESLIGTFFLVFLGVCLVLSLGVILARLPLLKSENKLEGLMTREGAFLAVNVLLVLITLTTLIGTIFPLISGTVLAKPVTVKPDFYNKLVLPLGLTLLAVMSVGPLLTYGKDAGKRLAKGLLVPSIVAAAAVVIVITRGYTDPWSLACTAIAAVTFASVGVGLYHAVRQRRLVEDDTVPTALLRVIDGNHRRYGGQFVHLGMVLFMIGVAGSSLFGVTEVLRLQPGETARLAGQSVRFDGLQQSRESNYTAIQATLQVTDPHTGMTQQLAPQLRFYDKAEQRSPQIAISSTLKQDLYFSFEGQDPQTGQVVIQAIINPLVAWIWIGGIVMSLGAVYCLLPPLIRQRSAVPASAEPHPTKAGAGTIHLALAGDGLCDSNATNVTLNEHPKPESTT